MQALVTGGAGFIGSHLVDLLLRTGWSVLALDDLSTGRHSNLLQHSQNPKLEFILGSVLDPQLVEEAVARSDVVYHLAAAVGVRLIIDHPLESLLTNIRGTETVLEKAHKYGTKVLVSSSSEIYGKSLDCPFKEDGNRLLGSPLVGRWSYSTSKAVEEVLAHAYWSAKGLPTVIARLFNTVGPRQSGEYGMVLPRFVKAALSGKDLWVFGSGTQTRCFCHVADIVPALVGLMDSTEAEGQAVNLGSTEEVTISELAELVVKVAGSPSQIQLIPYDEAYESDFEDMLRRVPDITKAKKLIGFAPATCLQQIVEEMVDGASGRRPER